MLLALQLESHPERAQSVATCSMDEDEMVHQLIIQIALHSQLVHANLFSNTVTFPYILWFIEGEKTNKSTKRVALFVRARIVGPSLRWLCVGYLEDSTGAPCFLSRAKCDPPFLYQRCGRASRGPACLSSLCPGHPRPHLLVTGPVSSGPRSKSF